MRYLSHIYLLVECGTVEGTSLTASGLWHLAHFGKYRKYYHKSVESCFLQPLPEKHHFRFCWFLYRTVHGKKASVFTPFLYPVRVRYLAYYWYTFTPFRLFQNAYLLIFYDLSRLPRSDPEVTSKSAAGSQASVKKRLRCDENKCAGNSRI